MNEGFCRDRAHNLPRVNSMRLASGNVIQNKRAYSSQNSEGEKKQKVEYF